MGNRSGVALQRPSIFTYDCFRKFLGEYASYLKSKDGESIRSLSHRAQFRSSNYLSLVIDGKRNLSSETTHRLCEAIGLLADEAEFFKNLVNFNQSKKPAEKSRHRLNLTKSKAFNNIVPLRSKTSRYYSNWYSIAIRELVPLADFCEEPEWIANKLGGAISAKEAEQTLLDLMELGLLKRDPTGRLQQVDKSVVADDSITSSALVDFHMNMIDKAKEALETLSYKERDISCITIPVNKELAEQIRLMVIEFRRTLLKMSEECQNPDEVAQVNFQFFPLTSKKNGDDNGQN